MKTYYTSEISALAGVHPNTVRFYEAQGFLPPVPRLANGYRLYSQRHLDQLQLIRLALKGEILSGSLRDEAIDIIKRSAAGDYLEALEKTGLYQRHLQEEKEQAEAAIELTGQILSGAVQAPQAACLGRREAALKTGVSMDVLRDWERNGLIHIPRKGNRRQYGVREMSLLKIIAVLRRANYSQAAVRRLIGKLEAGEADLLFALNTPDETEDIISVADRYITSLSSAAADAEKMRRLLQRMKEEMKPSSIPPL